MNKNVILRYMDAPGRIAFWTMDEAKALLIPLSLGLLFYFPLTGLGVSIFSYMSLKYIKQNLGDGLLKHAAYWYLPRVDKKLKVRIPSEIREYIG
jgi:conjugal transfer pilus assembly protein TraL